MARHIPKPIDFSLSWKNAKNPANRTWSPFIKLRHAFDIYKKFVFCEPTSIEYYYTHTFNNNASFRGNANNELKREKPIIITFVPKKIDFDVLDILAH